MEGHCSTGQSPQWAVVPMEGEEEEEEDMTIKLNRNPLNTFRNETCRWSWLPINH